MKNRLLKILSLALCLIVILSCCASQSGGQESSLPQSAASTAAPTEASAVAPTEAPAESTASDSPSSEAESTQLQYAQQFTIDRREDGCTLLTVENGSKYLVVPQGQEPAGELEEGTVVIQQPLTDVYLTATAAMCFFEALDSGEAVRFSGTKQEDWSVAYAQQAMERGDMIFAGKYREPDYELLLSEGCRLSVQSTMIERLPEVKEKLQELGIPVLVDRSSFEEHPLGRSEWVKFYGVLLGREKEAEELFQEQVQLFEQVSALPETGRTAAYFYFTAEGQPVTRPAGDYITRMLDLAGAENALAHVEGQGDSATVTMEMEDFYTAAKDADVLIYNGDMSGQLDNLDQLTALNPLMADFKAVQEGNVWCCRREMFQATLQMGTVIQDFHTIFSGEGDPPQYLYRLESGAGQ